MSHDEEAGADSRKPSLAGLDDDVIKDRAPAPFLVGCGGGGLVVVGIARGPIQPTTKRKSRVELTESEHCSLAGSKVCPKKI